MSLLQNVGYDSSAVAPDSATYPAVVNSAGMETIAFAAGIGGIVKASSGRLCHVLVTTVGTAELLFYDNASSAAGTVIGLIAANAAVGVYRFQFPAANGIYCAGGTNTPAVTVSYA